MVNFLLDVSAKVRCTQLELVGRPEEDHQQMSVRKQRKKPGKRREFVTLLRANRVMAKLENTSQTAIAITFLVMNLSTWLRRVFCGF
jgi:hypothetical protein